MEAGSRMTGKIFKGLGLLVVAGLVALFVYIWIQPDPGQYVVARHSDTPDQVSAALDSVLPDTGVSVDQLQTLATRYHLKIMGGTNEPLKGDTATWRSFRDRVIVELNRRGRPVMLPSSR